MEQERPFLDELLDLAVYAPIGLALTVAEDLPALIEKGRTRFSSQIGAAKFMSRFAMRTAKRRIDHLFDQPSGDATVTVLRTREAAPTPPVPRKERPEQELAIPGYDALAASQVVARLNALSLEELEAIEAHELAHRSRRTILTRIAQLKG